MWPRWRPGHGRLQSGCKHQLYVLNDQEAKKYADSLISIDGFHSCGAVGGYQSLLSLIRGMWPNLLIELVELTGYQIPNLSHMLQTMESYGLVTLKKNAH